MDKDSHDGSPEEHRDDKRDPAITTPRGAHDDDAQADRDAKQEQDIRDIAQRERVLFRVAVLGVFIAAASAVVSTLQWQVMREQLADSRKAAADSDKATARTLAALEKQANASNDLAEANKIMLGAASLSAQSSQRIAKANEQSTVNAGRAMQLTQEIARSEQRAFLAVVGDDIKPVIGYVYSPKIRIVNDGKSVARNIVGSMRVSVHNITRYVGDIRKAPTIIYGYNVTRRVALQPNEVFVMEGFIPNSAGLTDDFGNVLPEVMDAQMAKLYIDDGCIVVACEVTYTDIFDDERRLSFCYRAVKGVGYRPCDDQQ